MREVPVDGARPRILGMHLEGPFLSPTRLGTHQASARRDPDPALLERLLDAGPVRLMTLAPELPGAGELIDRLLERGDDRLPGAQRRDRRAGECGVRPRRARVTHLFNAMRPFLHRDPGIAGAALARDDVIVSIILDEIHLAPETARVAWRAAAGRIALVTDAITAAGVADGEYSFGNFDVFVRRGRPFAARTACWRGAS